MDHLIVAILRYALGVLISAKRIAAFSMFASLHPILKCPYIHLPTAKVILK